MLSVTEVAQPWYLCRQILMQTCMKYIVPKYQQSNLVINSLITGHGKTHTTDMIVIVYTTIHSVDIPLERQFEW